MEINQPSNSDEAEVNSLNGLTGDIILAAGTNITLQTSGNTITINASGGGGSVISVSGTTNRITSTGGTTPVIDISASYIGQSSITTIGTLVSGAVPASLVTAGTFGTGAYVMNTSLTNPLLIGGTAVGSTLSLKGTTANGTSTAIAIQANVGNNGATNALNIFNTGNVTIGATTVPQTNAKFTIYGNGYGALVSQQPDFAIVTTGGSGASFELDASGSLSGKKYSFASTNSANGFGAGAFTVYNATDGFAAQIIKNSYVTMQILSQDSVGTGLVLNPVSGGDQFLLIAAGSGYIPGFHIYDFTTSISRLFINSTGLVGIGVTSPTARLHLLAGTATANTAPLKFTSGVNLTTAEAGAMEFTTDDYYLTITTGAARKGIVLNNGTNLTSGKVPVATTNGRLVDSTSATLTAAGITNVVTNVSLVAQAADINATTLTSTAGLYRVSYSLQDTTADVTAGAVVLTLSYTDGAGATTSTATQSLVGIGRQSGSVYLQLASGSLTYATTHTGLFGTAVYALYITLERVN